MKRDEMRRELLLCYPFNPVTNRHLFCLRSPTLSNRHTDIRKTIGFELNRTSFVYQVKWWKWAKRRRSTLVDYETSLSNWMERTVVNPLCEGGNYCMRDFPSKNISTNSVKCQSMEMWRDWTTNIHKSRLVLPFTLSYSRTSEGGKRERGHVIGSVGTWVDLCGRRSHNSASYVASVAKTSFYFYCSLVKSKWSQQ